MEVFESTLDILATELLDRFGDEAAAAGRPLFFIFGSSDGHIDPESFEPVPEPYGMVAPRHVAALAAVGGGRLRMLDSSAECPAVFRSGLGGGLRLACVLDRSGGIGWRMVLPDGGVSNMAPECGRMIDMLRRCLELPTDPPTVPVDLVATVSWLKILYEVAAIEDGLLGWSQVSRLKPEPGAAVTWEQIRICVASSPPGSWVVEPTDAAWMDEGMFARESAALLPDPDELLDGLRRRLTPSAARRLGHAVQVSRFEPF